MIKVAALLIVLAVGLVRGEDVEVTTVTAEEMKLDDVDTPVKSDDEKNPEKRGLFRVTGVHGENPQYQVVYALPQQIPQQQYQHPVETRAVPSASYKPYMGYSAQPTYQQPFVIPSPSMPVPYSTPTPMILLMMPPHPGNPYGSLILVPASNFFTPNHIMPYNAPGRVPIQFVPQYVPVPVKGYQGSAYPTAHFKDQYSQKPLVQSLGPQYQEQQSSGEDVSQEHPSSAASQDYGARVRPIDQYVKG
ncbi:uncharacterized protein LOC128986972 [Macrosteles quadrilineatus]|uniref:uncharacterized protein LOC128986972 n=1 Tax=Macrosteles quadrilineatus TaxID=74068 RepID=UPI0023E23C65|nr:uncharacterized protein LOC128986972 [Macrosteles quadrilineatus]